MAKDTYIPREELVEIHKEFNKVREKAEKELMKIPGVIAVGVGLKETKGEVLKELCFKVTVEKKKEKSKIKKKDRIPEVIYGFKTDVIEMPRPVPTIDSNKYRPLIGGIQIANSNSSGYGTLGCFAKRTADNKIVALSNWHVMMSRSDGINDEKIGQPSHNKCCSCCACNEVGKVVDGRLNSNMDAAIALLDGQDADTTPDIRYINEVQEIGIIGGSEAFLSGETVFKRGRTSERTVGQILNDSAAFPLTYDSYGNHVVNFVNQLTIVPTAPAVVVSSPGDSGSVLVNEHNKVVGLIFASDSTGAIRNGYASPIIPVLTALNITILDSTFPSTGVPLNSIATSPNAISLRSALAQLEEELSGYKEGQRIFELFKVHRSELLTLVRTKREVMAAWHRYQGPAYLAHIARSVRRENKPIPDQINGISLQNLLLKMTAVLQRNGSEELSKTVSENYLNIVHILSNGKSPEDWKENLADLSKPMDLHLT